MQESLQYDKNGSLERFTIKTNHDFSYYESLAQTYEVQE